MDYLRVKLSSFIVLIVNLVMLFAQCYCLTDYN